MNVALANGFQAFSLLHGLTFFVGVVGIAALVWAGVIARRRGRDLLFTRWIASVGLVFWFAQQSYYVLVEQNWADSLPLHVCDLAGLVGPLALLLRWRTLRTTLHFWALGLTIWGLLTPALTDGPEHLRYWLFWISHCAVIFYAGYDCIVNRYRPFAKDCGMACLITMAYVALLLPFNLANEGWNYAYLGDVQLDAATPLDLLPDWPWRIIGLQAAGVVVLVLVWLPWGVGRKLRRRPES
ncbi:MAG: TIGR02206 family membrane protein [Planctomycetota bacterium]